MQCPCDSNILANVERLQSLIALETTLDDELDELERLYNLNLRKLDWLQAVGHQDLCDVITKNIDKTESLLRMYRPMLENACAEKMKLVRSIMDTRELRSGGDGDDLDFQIGDGEEEEEELDGVDRLPGTMSEMNEDDDDEFWMRYT